MFQFDSVKLTIEEYIRFNQITALKSSAVKSSLLINRLISPAIFVISYLVLLAMYGWDLSILLSVLVFGTVISLPMCLTAKRRMLRSINKNIRRNAKKDKLPFDGDCSMIFAEDAIYASTASGRSSVLPYSLVTEIIVTNTAIYIYQNMQQAHLLPLHVFSNMLESDRFITFIQQKTGVASTYFDDSKLPTIV